MTAVSFFIEFEEFDGRPSSWQYYCQKFPSYERAIEFLNKKIVDFGEKTGHITELQDMDSFDGTSEVYTLEEAIAKLQSCRGYEAEAEQKAKAKADRDKAEQEKNQLRQQLIEAQQRLKEAEARKALGCLCCLEALFGSSQAGYPQAVSAQGSRSNRHFMGISDQPVYKPLKDYLRKFTPEKTCSDYLVDDAPRSFKEFVPGSEQHLPFLVAEASKVTQSKLQFVSPPGGDGKLAFALVCYSLDLRPFGIPDEQNFFDIVNKILQKRDAKLLQGLEGYLHYFFKAIDELPEPPEKEFYRGVPAAALSIFQANYTSGRIVHWSGITSVSGSLNVAKGFAEPGGIIIKIRAKSAKSIKAYSAFPEEDEFILLPNWEATVTEETTKKADGYYYIELLEKAGKKFVF